MICTFVNLRKVFLALTVIVLITTVKLCGKVIISSHNSGSEHQPSNHTLVEDKKGFLKIFHLDLKGGPPKMSYLLHVLPVVKEAGANAILIEYEDMFPFSGRLRNISARNAYAPDEVARLVAFAEGLDMQVIPLVQTFGHLEYVLKLKEFQHLRELDTFPQEICPSKKEAVDLVKEMIRQVMALHGNSRFLHIGCDEVHHLGACSRCSRLRANKVFAKHVGKMGHYVRTRYPGVTPLVWDDMMRRWTFHDLLNSKLGLAVEPVVWVYGNNIYTLVPRFVWNLYLSIFPRVWVASAFKGAFGEMETLPDLDRHLENNLSWMKMLTSKGEEAHKVQDIVAGVFVTGWSRYDHFAVLCELLPVGIPSLVLDLVFLDRRFQKDKFGGFARWMEILRCPESFRIDFSTIKQRELFKLQLGNCSFPGSNLYAAVTRFLELRSRVRGVRTRIDSSGWVSRYNLKKNFTSPWRLLEMFPEEGFAGELLRKDIAAWKSSVLPLMTQYFDSFTIVEWQEQNIRPLEETLTTIQSDFQNLLLRKTWPRRPLG